MPPSRYRAPRSRAHSSIATASAGDPHVRFTKVRPESAWPAASELNDSYTCSYRVTHATVTGLASTASAAVAATVAPADPSGAHLAAVRFQTVTVWPAARKVRASVAPMFPSPMTLTCSDTTALP